MNGADNITLAFRAALKIIAAQHKVRLAVGLLLGGFFESARLGYVDAFDGSETSNFIAAFPTLGSLFLGILLTLMPLLFHKPRVKEDEKAIMIFIDELITRGELSSTDRKWAYRSILQKYVDAAGPNFSIEKARALIERENLDWSKLKQDRET